MLQEGQDPPSLCQQLSPSADSEHRASRVGETSSSESPNFPWTGYFPKYSAPVCIPPETGHGLLYKSTVSGFGRGSCRGKADFP